MRLLPSAGATAEVCRDPHDSRVARRTDVGTKPLHQPPAVSLHLVLSMSPRNILERPLLDLMAEFLLACGADRGGIDTRNGCDLPAADRDCMRPDHGQLPGGNRLARLQGVGIPESRVR